jgi:hypothetical protein
MSTTADEVDEDDFGDFAATSDPSEPFSASEPDPRNNSEDEPETLAPEPEPAPETPKSAAFDDIFDFKSAFAAAPKTVEAALKEADAFLVLDAPVSPRMSESRRSEDEGPNGEVIDAFGAVNADLGAEEGAEMEREDTELARTPEPPTPTSAINDPAQEDDFGDFEAEAGEQSVSVAGEGGPPEPPVPEPKPSRAEEEDDDFGDFGEADDAPSELAVEPESEPTTDKAPEQSLAQAVSTNRTMDLSGLPEPDFTSKESAHATIGPLLAVLFPDAEVDSLESTLEPGPPLLVEQSDASGRTFLAPNPELKDSEWQKIFRSLAEKPTYDEASGLPLFMWRRSEVRKAWLKALQVPVNLDDVRCLAYFSPPAC